MERDCNVINARCVFENGSRVCNLMIRQGTIVKILPVSEKPEPCKEEIDASGYLVMPGMIDSHVHIRGGEFSYREDFSSGSKAALSAGVTTILEMPGCAKPATTLENYQIRVTEVKDNGYTDFGMYGGAGGDNLEEIPRIAAAGAIGFKTFQMEPVKGREREFYGLCAQTYEDMVKVMEAIKKTGLTLTVHCENQHMIDELVPVMKEKYGESLRGFIESRPPEAEISSAELTIRAAKETGCRTIIAHVSTPQTIAMIQKARQEGYEVYAETCAHYLTFDKEEMIPFGVFARMKPPFRDRILVDELVKCLAKGQIDIIGSDHAPFTREEKLRNGENVWTSVDGLYGLELSFPLLLRLVEIGKLTYEMLIECFSRKTADIFGLSKKGRIAEGCDADLVFVEKGPSINLFEKEKMLCKCRDCAVIYDGVPTRHKIVMTMRHGSICYKDGIVQTKGQHAEILKGKGAR